jgi:tRNA G18 (ribose-2'-O)-methylase SpoU
VGLLHEVASLDDPRCARYRAVASPDLAQREGRFVAEGRLVVRRLLAQARLEVESVMVTPAAQASLADALAARADLPVYVVPQAVMNGIAGFNIHRGCLALGRCPDPPAWPTLAKPASRLLVLERIGNPDNIGLLFRNAAAFGVDGVLLGPACGDPLYRKAIRVSMGAALVVPFARAEPWPHVLDALRRDGWQLMALAPAGGETIARAARRTRGRRVAVVVGHEGDGLTSEALHGCDLSARIPMAAGVDSVNVATAAAIALYEVSCEAQEPPA